MLKLRESVLADIRSKNIRPRPRWQYILLHSSLWGISLVTILLGSVACALMILEFSLPERAYLLWEMEEDTGWLLALPYLWGIGMIFALTLGYFLFSRTKRGYRLHASLIAGILVIGSIVGGEILYATHAIHFWEREVQRFAPGYRNFRQGFAHMMPRPEEGILPLRVLSVDGAAITGFSPDGQPWNVLLHCRDEECADRKNQIKINRPTIFGGKISGKHSFNAEDIKVPPKFRGR